MNLASSVLEYFYIKVKLNKPTNHMRSNTNYWLHINLYNGHIIDFSFYLVYILNML